MTPSRPRRAAPPCWIALALILSFVGCKEQDALDPEKLPDEDGVLSEAHGDDLVVSWLVEPSGRLRAMIADDGQLLKEVGGDVRVKGIDDETNDKHELEVDDGLMKAELGALEDVTEIRYRLKARGHRLRGTIHLPDGGTAELGRASARELEEEKGPHRGRLQPVGDEVVEIVGRRGGREVRVYLLDDDLKPLPIVDRELTLIAGGRDAELVALRPHASAGYFVGKLEDDPVKLTIVVRHGGSSHLALVGHRPGEIYVVGRHGLR